MDVLKLVEISASLLTCIGVIFISFLKIEGLWIMTCSSCLWLYSAWKHSYYWFIIQCIFLIIFNIIGIIEWTKRQN